MFLRGRFSIELLNPTNHQKTQQFINSLQLMNTNLNYKLFLYHILVNTGVAQQQLRALLMSLHPEIAVTVRYIETR